MAATLAPERRARLGPRRLGRRADGCLGDVLRRRGRVEGPVPLARRAVLHPARARWAQLAGRDRLHADPLPAAAPDRADGSDGGLQIVTDPVLGGPGTSCVPSQQERRRVAIWLRTTTRDGRSGFGLLGGVSPLGQAGRASAGAGELPPVACSGAARATLRLGAIVTHESARWAAIALCYEHGTTVTTCNQSGSPARVSGPAARCACAAEDTDAGRHGGFCGYLCAHHAAGRPFRTVDCNGEVPGA